MAKENKTITKSTKEEAMMYFLLLVGVSAIVSLFAVNVILINKTMDNIVLENQYLHNTLRLERERNTSEAEIDHTLEDDTDSGETEDPYYELWEEDLTVEGTPGLDE